MCHPARSCPGFRRAGTHSRMYFLNAGHVLPRCTEHSEPAHARSRFPRHCAPRDSRLHREGDTSRLPRRPGILAQGDAAKKITEASGKPLHPVSGEWILCHNPANPFLAALRVDDLRMRHEPYLPGLKVGGAQPASQTCLKETVRIACLARQLLKLRCVDRDSRQLNLELRGMQEC